MITYNTHAKTKEESETIKTLRELNEIYQAENNSLKKNYDEAVEKIISLENELNNLKNDSLKSK